MEEKKWWKEAVVYQIYPRSFMDSNGDGVGDLRGIKSRLSYLKLLGIDVIWLSTTVPMSTSGLWRAERAKIIHIVIIISGATQKTEKNRITGDPVLADQLGSMIRRQICIIFTCFPKNSRTSTGKIQNSDSTMISKDQRFPDGIVHGNEKYGDSSPYVNNGPRVHEYLKEMNQKVISKFDWMTVGEGAGAGVEDAKRYAGADRGELDMIFTFEHVNLGQTQYGKWSDGSFDLVELKKVFEKWEDGLEGVAWNSLYWDNHDQPRAVSRFGNDSEEYREISAKMLATCLHFMKGTPYIYQGEELGMTNRKCKDFSEFRDIEIKNAYRDFVGGGILDEETMLKFVNAIGRDNARFPMHWDDSDNAGFTTGTPWISVNENYKNINAAAQINDPDSVFSYYKKLIELRHQMEIIVYGVYESKALEHPDVFAYTRTLGNEKLFVVCNFREQEMDFALEDGFTGEEDVLISNYKDVIRNENGIHLRPYEAKVFYRK